MSSTSARWDPELYEARHAFVWRFGEGVIELLDPKPGEHILDVGCGTGQLTHKIAERGATVVGLDASPEMIGQARQNYPQLKFALGDGAHMTFDNEFDAVFSNAALHWILDASGAARSMYRALRSGGRFIAELGGKGNIQLIETAVRTRLQKYASEPLPSARTFFPSLAEYAAVLESSGFEVRFAALFERPTPLEGEQGM